LSPFASPTPPDPESVSPNSAPAASASDVRYQQTLAFLYDRINYEKMASGTARYPFRLHRTGMLLSRLGLDGYLAEKNDQPAVPLVHIAGTKGKGSTATMVAAILSAAGLKTGLYTSPHLIDLEERFQIDAQPCPRDELGDLVDKIRPVAEQLAAEGQGEPSFFELTTAIALLHFHTQKCDAIVLEVGLGGRLDSTNVCISTVTAITSIGLDHQHVLGNTLAEIAGEKAGIIKPGVPLVSGVRDGVAAETIAAQAKQHGAELIQLGHDFDVESQANATWGSALTFVTQQPSKIPHPLPSLQNVPLALEGQHQTQNAAVAIAIACHLRSETKKSPGLEISDEAIQTGLRNARCIGRVERFDLPNDTVVIVDAAHNDDSITALCRCLELRKRSQKVAIVFGTSRDKSAESMLKLLAPHADLLILTRFEGNPRFRSTEDLLPWVPADAVRKTITQQTPTEACQAGLEFLSAGGTMVVCGSFFLAAETRPWIQSMSQQDGFSTDS
jgi:dihydrofolate synthase/folylpolyglutamate synthase